MPQRHGNGPNPWGSQRCSTVEWRKLRAFVLDRDQHVCHVCHRVGANEVDHVVPLGQGGTDDPRNLAAIHRRPCHAAKSAQEANAARVRYTTRRPPEPHPGLRL